MCWKLYFSCANFRIPDSVKSDPDIKSIITSPKSVLVLCKSKPAILHLGLGFINIFQSILNTFHLSFCQQGGEETSYYPVQPLLPLYSYKVLYIFYQANLIISMRQFKYVKANLLNVCEHLIGKLVTVFSLLNDQ